MQRHSLGAKLIKLLFMNFNKVWEMLRSRSEGVWHVEHGRTCFKLVDKWSRLIRGLSPFIFFLLFMYFILYIFFIPCCCLLMCRVFFSSFSYAFTFTTLPIPRPQAPFSLSLFSPIPLLSHHLFFLYFTLHVLPFVFFHPLFVFYFSFFPFLCF